MTQETSEFGGERGPGWLPRSTKDRWSAAMCCVALLLAMVALAALVASLI